MIERGTKLDMIINSMSFFKDCIEIDEMYRIKLGNEMDIIHFTVSTSSSIIKMSSGNDKQENTTLMAIESKNKLVDDIQSVINVVNDKIKRRYRFLFIQKYIYRDSDQEVIEKYNQVEYGWFTKERQYYNYLNEIDNTLIENVIFKF